MNRFRKLRLQNGYTVNDLASKIGVSRNVIRQWECDIRSPNVENSIKLANLYNLTMDNIVGRTPIRETVKALDYIPNMLCQLRTDAGLTQLEISKQLDISNVLYSNWELGVKIPSINNLLRLSNFYGCNAGMLLNSIIEKHKDYEMPEIYKKTEIRKNCEKVECPAEIEIYDSDVTSETYGEDEYSNEKNIDAKESNIVYNVFNMLKGMGYDLSDRTIDLKPLDIDHYQIYLDNRKLGVYIIPMDKIHLY